MSRSTPPVIYLNNKELLEEVKQCKANNNTMSDRLARMLMLLCSRYVTKPNYVNYTYRDDMEAFALMMLCRSWSSFKPEMSDNPFSYYSQCIDNSLKQFLNQEKRQRNIRDAMMVENGMSPSYSYMANDDLHSVEDEESYADTEVAVQSLKQLPTEYELTNGVPEPEEK